MANTFVSNSKDARSNRAGRANFIVFEERQGDSQNLTRAAATLDACSIQATMKSIGVSSNGRTEAFEPSNHGSNPCPPANIT